MRIGFDAKRAFTNFTGLGNYSRDTVRILSNFFNKLDVPHKFDATKLAPPVNSPNLFIKSILFILVFYIQGN